MTPRGSLVRKRRGRDGAISRYYGHIRPLADSLHGKAAAPQRRQRNTANARPIARARDTIAPFQHRSALHNPSLPAVLPRQSRSPRLPRDPRQPSEPAVERLEHVAVGPARLASGRIGPKRLRYDQTSAVREQHEPPPAAERARVGLPSSSLERAGRRRIDDHRPRVARQGGGVDREAAGRAGGEAGQRGPPPPPHPPGEPRGQGRGTRINYLVPPPPHRPRQPAACRATGTPVTRSQRSSRAGACAKPRRSG